MKMCSNIKMVFILGHQGRGVDQVRLRRLEAVAQAVVAREAVHGQAVPVPVGHPAVAVAAVQVEPGTDRNRGKKSFSFITFCLKTYLISSDSNLRVVKK